jgi:hypothetical protein
MTGILYRFHIFLLRKRPQKPAHLLGHKESVLFFMKIFRHKL